MCYTGSVKLVGVDDGEVPPVPIPNTEVCYTDSVRSVGVDDGEVPPVPIPNTEVKLTCAEDS